jgi:hypothetical protein
MRMLKFIRSTLFALLCGTIVCFLLYPAQYRLDASRGFFVFIAVIMLAVSFRRVFTATDSPIDDRSRSRMDTLQFFAFFTAILLLQCGFLNEHIYGPDPKRASLYNGYFTYGGFMPSSDSAQYLIGIQSFIKYGITISMSIFRPQGMFWSSFLYKLTGESVLVFFYVQAFLSSVTIYISALALRRFIAMPWVLLFTWFLSEYIGLYQGTFMTELTAMPFALLSFSLLLYGWGKERFGLSLIGVAMLAMAFEMRPAIFMLPPLLFLLLGWMPGSYRRFSWKRVLMSFLIYAITIISNRMVIGMLEYPPLPVSNTYGKLYQIYRGSDDWNEAANIKVPLELNKPGQKQSYRQAYVHHLIRTDPMPLFRNTMNELLKTIQQPQKHFEVIDRFISKRKSIVLLVLISLGFFIPRRSRQHLILQGLMVCYFMAAILSMPFLHAEFRVMSVTHPIVILGIVLAFSNVWTIAKGVLTFLLSAYSPAIANRIDGAGSGMSPYDQDDSNLKFLILFSAVMLSLSILSPLILDQARPAINNTYRHKNGLVNESPTSIFILDVKHTPRMHFTAGRQEVSLINDQMPLQRIGLTWTNDSRLKNGFYLFNAINHRDFPKAKNFSAFLIMPDNIASGIPWDRTDTLWLKVSRRLAKGVNDSLPMLLAEEVFLREYP